MMLECMKFTAIVVAIIVHAAEAIGNSAQVYESAPFLNQKNTLTFVLQFSQNLSAGAMVTIAGLNRSQTFSKTILVENPDISLDGNSVLNATWEATTGTLFLNTTNDIKALSPVTLMFTLRNSAEIQPPIRPLITVKVWRLQTSSSARIRTTSRITTTTTSAVITTSANENKTSAEHASNNKTSTQSTAINTTSTTSSQIASNITTSTAINTTNTTSSQSASNITTSTQSTAINTANTTSSQIASNITSTQSTAINTANTTSSQIASNITSMQSTVIATTNTTSSQSASNNTTSTQSTAIGTTNTTRSQIASNITTSTQSTTIGTTNTTSSQIASNTTTSAQGTAIGTTNTTSSQTTSAQSTAIGTTNTTSSQIASNVSTSTQDIGTTNNTNITTVQTTTESNTTSTRRVGSRNLQNSRRDGITSHGSSNQTIASSGAYATVVVASFYGPPVYLGSIAQGFTERNISQTSVVVFTNNNITIVLTPNFPLPQGSMITVGGIFLVRDDSGGKTIFGTADDLFEPNGNWTQKDGSLTLRVANDWNVSVSTSFSFSVTNRAAPQDPVMAWVQAIAVFAGDDFDYPFHRQYFKDQTILGTVRPAGGPLAQDFYIDQSQSKVYVSELGGLFVPAGSFPEGIQPMVTFTVQQIINTTADPCPGPASLDRQIACSKRITGSVAYFEPSGISFSPSAVIMLPFDGVSPAPGGNAITTISKLTTTSQGVSWDGKSPANCDSLKASLSDPGTMDISCPTPNLRGEPTSTDLLSQGFFMSDTLNLGQRTTDEFGFLHLSGGFMSGTTNSFSTYGVITQQNLFDRDSNFTPSSPAYLKKYFYYLGIGVAILGILVIVFLIDKASSMMHYCQGFRILGTRSRKITLNTAQKDRKLFMQGHHCHANEGDDERSLGDLTKLFEAQASNAVAILARRQSMGARRLSTKPSIQKRRGFTYFESDSGVVISIHSEPEPGRPPITTTALPLDDKPTKKSFSIEKYTRSDLQRHNLLKSDSIEESEHVSVGGAPASRELTAAREISRRTREEYRLALEDLARHGVQPDNKLGATQNS